MRRRIPETVAAGLLAATATLLAASAASSGASSAPLGAGSHVVGRCHTGPVSVTYHQDVAGGPVSGLTVTGLAATCDGGRLRAAVSDGADASAAVSPAATVSAGSATVTLSPALPAEQVARYRIAITGP